MTKDIDGQAPPAGFVPQPGRGPFTSHNGPFYHSPDADGARQAFLALARHCNSVGIVHGGMLSAFLDGLLASAAAQASQATPVTVHLSIDYLDMGRAGDWIVGDARVTRLTRDLAFAEGRAQVLGQDLTRATGVFKLIRRRPG